jgi:ribosomal protein S18 acetylase RimI-like enzyme
MRLRRATGADDEFCYRLHVATMRGSIEPMYGWDEDVQRGYHTGWFDADRLMIIEDDDGTAVGVLDVTEEGDHLYLSRIEVLPEAQGRGLGTAVLRDLIGRGRTIRLHVFTNNMRARRLYERLGFNVDQEAEREGRDSMYRSARGSMSPREPSSPVAQRPPPVPGSEDR